MSWTDVLSTFSKVTKQFHLIVERVDRLEKDDDFFRKECEELRKDIAAPTSRVAVLEEGRKTTTAEVKLALVESIAAWENQKLREELGRLKHQLPPPPPA